MKKIGIVADNYKVERFKKELTKAGFTFTFGQFTAKTMAFVIECEDHQVNKVHALCISVENHFKRVN